jgi:hypothetical protein
VFAAKVPATSAGKAIAAARKVMTTLAEAAPGETEMPGIVMSSQGPTAEMLLASAWLDAESYKLSTGSANDAGRVRPEDIRRVAGRLFGNSAPLAIVVLGNASELQAQLGYKVELRTNSPETKPAINQTVPPRKP